MPFKQINESDVNFFQSIIGKENVFTSLEERKEFGHDETEDFNFPPEVALTPRNTNEVSQICSYCNQNNISITPIGAQTGLSGGALSIYGGVGLSLKKLNKIIDIDTKNLQVTVEPAVITQVLQEEVAKHDLYYAPDPASRGSCSIGGNLAENSGGPRAVKYGVTSDWVLNLEVVLPNGEIIWTGANTLKNSTGYNLTQLVVGSEGTLGIITKAVLKLIPLPKNNQLLLIPFHDAEDACKAVAEIFQAGITPSAMEFMERDAINFTMDFMGEKVVDISDDVQAHLLVEVDGNELDLLFKDCERIFEVVEKYNTDEILFAESEAQKNKLWQLRRKVGEAVKTTSIYKEEDTVVPRYELATLLKGVKEIGKEFGFQSVCYGHAGDGNLHINILKGNLSEKEWNEDLHIAIRKIFDLTVKLGGTISGEHGIGFVQKNYMNIPFNEVQISLMREIKRIFDPLGILNPGKIFPDN